MKKRTYQICRIPEFRDWFNEQTEKARFQIDDRLSKIQDEGYFGDHKSVIAWELKWKNGRRVYFTFIPENKILVLLGGNKNGQDKDIRSAKNFCKKHTT